MTAPELPSGAEIPTTPKKIRDWTKAPVQTRSDPCGACATDLQGMYRVHDPETDSYLCGSCAGLVAKVRNGDLDIGDRRAARLYLPGKLAIVANYVRNGGMKVPDDRATVITPEMIIDALGDRESGLIHTSELGDITGARPAILSRWLSSRHGVRSVEHPETKRTAYRVEEIRAALENKIAA
jgi:hypothetical protein